MRKDRNLCRTCASYYMERYGHCVLIGKRVQGSTGGRPCWKRRAKKHNNSVRVDAGSVLCQCGGALITERTTSGQLADEHDVFRVHCERCPMSSRWLCHEADCLAEIIDGMGLRRKPNARLDREEEAR